MGRAERVGARAARGASAADEALPAATGATPGGTALAAVAAAAAGLVAFHGALAYGFSQDDFLSLARVQGLAPRLAGPWRILANQWFWDALVRAFGLHATAFHAVVLAAHALAAALLAVLLARRFGAPAALLAAVVWASHPAHAGALDWVSANSDPFATLFALATAAAFFARGPARWAAVPAFAVALAWKESVLLLPLALAALAAWGPPPRRPLATLARDPVALALLALAALWGAGIFAFAHRLAAAGNAYEVTPGAAGAHLLAYLSWLPSLAVYVQRDASDAARPAFVAMGAGVGAALLALLAWRPWRERGAPGALVAFVLLLAPVLPLGHHTYRYYLHAPLAAAAVAGAALFAALVPPAPGARAWGVAGALALVLATASTLWVHAEEVAPFDLPGSRADRTIDRALIASAAAADLESAALPPHARLVLWSPQALARARAAGRDPAVETYEESNVRAALLDGLALRVLVPALDSVRFARAFADADTTAYWAVYRWDGHLRVASTRELARVVASAPR